MQSGTATSSVPAAESVAVPGLQRTTSLGFASLRAALRSGHVTSIRFTTLVACVN